MREVGQVSRVSNRQLADKLVREESRVGTILGVAAQADRLGLQGDQAEDAERKDQYRNQRFKQREPALTRHGGRRHQHILGSLAALMAVLHMRICPPAKTSIW